MGWHREEREGGRSDGGCCCLKLEKSMHICWVVIYHLGTHTSQPTYRPWLIYTIIGCPNLPTLHCAWLSDAHSVQLTRWQVNRYTHCTNYTVNRLIHAWANYTTYTKTACMIYTIPTLHCDWLTDTYMYHTCTYMAQLSDIHTHCPTNTLTGWPIHTLPNLHLLTLSPDRNHCRWWHHMRLCSGFWLWCGDPSPNQPEYCQSFLPSFPVFGSCCNLNHLKPLWNLLKCTNNWNS